MTTQCLAEAGPGARVEVTVRFLHVVRRQVARRTDVGLEPVEELTVGGERHLSWDEAVERELKLPPVELGESAAEHLAVTIEGGAQTEDLLDSEGWRAGALTRSWEPLEGTLAASAESLGGKLHRLTVRLANTTASAGGGPRDAALRRTFCSTHAVLRAFAAAFVSLTDPPPRLADAAASCRNEGVWPVLVGEPGDRQTMLAAPIILEDYPRIAPESPGDLFDGAEIDQLLVLNILSLTDEEKAEMRDSDPRTREILERTEALSGEQLMRLHGAIREYGMARR
jgi:hydrogenase maturation protease